MAFSFGFSGGDIDIDDSEIEQPVQGHSISAPVENDLPMPVEAKRHEMGEWVSLIFKSLNKYSLANNIHRFQLSHLKYHTTSSSSVWAMNKMI